MNLPPNRTLAVLAALTLCAISALGQQPPPEFEVASIKPAAKDEQGIIRRDCSGNRFTEAGLPVSWLIRWAYQLSPSRIIGLPDWTNDQAVTYEIEATAPSAVSEAQCEGMLQSLLISRFRMAAHRERREIRAYDLTVARKGSKMRQVSADAKGSGSGVTYNGNQYQTPSGIPAGLSMAEFSSFLSQMPAVGLPVLDRTELQGIYSFALNFSVREGDGRPTIWTALEEQLGLKLESIKTPVEVLVVDHIERPTPN